MINDIICKVLWQFYFELYIEDTIHTSIKVLWQTVLKQPDLLLISNWFWSIVLVGKFKCIRLFSKLHFTLITARLEQVIDRKQISNGNDKLYFVHTGTLTHFGDDSQPLYWLTLIRKHVVITQLENREPHYVVNQEMHVCSA